MWPQPFDRLAPKVTSEPQCQPSGNHPTGVIFVVMIGAKGIPASVLKALMIIINTPLAIIPNDV